MHGAGVVEQRAIGPASRLTSTRTRRVAMGKYVLVYQGGGMADTEEAQQAAMAAWGAWFGALGGAVVDGGAPFGASTAVGGGAATSALTGYSILEADDLAGATKLAEGCPVLKDGGTVDVYEAIDVSM